MFKTKMQVLPVPTVFLQVVGKACELSPKGPSSRNQIVGARYEGKTSL